MTTKATPRAVKRPRSDDANAFLPDPEGGPARMDDDLAEMLGEDFVTGAISGEDGSGDEHERVVDEEMGGPFVPSSAATEFARGTDASNPADAEIEAFPTAHSER